MLLSMSQLRAQRASVMALVRQLPFPADEKRTHGCAPFQPQSRRWHDEAAHFEWCPHAHHRTGCFRARLARHGRHCWLRGRMGLEVRQRHLLHGVPGDWGHRGLPPGITAPKKYAHGRRRCAPGATPSRSDRGELRLRPLCRIDFLVPGPSRSPDAASAGRAARGRRPTPLAGALHDRRGQCV